MPTVAPPPKPANPVLVDSEHYIDGQIQRTRRALKLVDLMAGLLTLSIGLLAFLFVAALLDQWVIPGGLGDFGRGALFAVLAVGVLWYAWRQFVPLFRAINPVYAAHTIERGTPTLKNSLLNLLLFRTHRREVSPRVYHALEQQAAMRLSMSEIDIAIDRSALLRLGYFLLAIVAICAVYAVLSPKNMAISAVRVLAPWTDVPPPSRVQILDIKPGETSVAKGERLPVSADIHGLRADETVRLHYSTVDEQLVDESLPMKLPTAGGRRYEGQLPRGGDAAAESGVQQDLVYWIEAGDARSKKFKANVFSKPTIVVQKVQYRYPDYTGQGTKEAANTGDIHGLEGTTVTISALANQPIKSAFVDFDADGGNDLAMKVEGDHATATFQLALRKDRRTSMHPFYSLRFTTTEGRANTDPPKYRIDVTPDYAPEVRITTPEELEKSVLADEVVSIGVEARDPDFAVQNVRLVGKVGPREIEVATLLSKDHEGRFNRAYPFKPADAQLKPGDTLEYWAEAQDNRRPESNMAFSDHRQLKILGGNQAPPNAQQQGNPGQQGGKGQQGENGGEKQNQDGQGGEQGQAGGSQKGGNAADKKGGDQSKGNEAGGADGQSGKNDKGQDQKNNGQGESAAAQPNNQQPNNQQQPGGANGQGDNKQQPQNGQQPGEPQQGNNSNNGAGGANSAQPQSNSPQQGDSKQQPGQAGSGGQQNQPQNADQQSGQASPAKSPNGNAPQNGQTNSGGSQGGQPQQGERQGGEAKGAQQGEQNSKVSSKGDADGDAIKRMLEHMKQQDAKSGKPGGEDNSNAAQQDQSSKDGQQQPGGEAKNQQSGDPNQQPNNAQSAQQSGNSQNAADQSKKPGASQQSAAKPNASQGDDSAQSSGGQQNQQSPKGNSKQSGQPQGAAKTADAKTQGDHKQGNNEQSSREGGMDQNNQNPGAGRDSNDQQGAPVDPSVAKQTREKPGADKRSGEDKNQETPTTAEKNRESNSRGDQNGSQAGGGEKGAGQQAQAKGKGDPGQHEAADQGASQANEKGPGETGDQAGKDQLASGKTGQSSGDQKGNGTQQRDSTTGESASAGGPTTGGESQDQTTAKQQDKQQAKPEKQTNANQGEKQANQKPQDAKGNNASNSPPGQPSGQPSSSQPGQQGTTGATPPQAGGHGGPAGDVRPSSSESENQEDKANLDFARKQTDLVLERLDSQLAKKQVDPNLLKSLGWSEDDLRRFVARWKDLKAKADKDPNDAGANRELDAALRSLGLRPQGPTRIHGSAKADQIKNLNDSYRGRAPLEYAERVRLYNKDVASQGAEQRTGENGK
jgi:hypothetical protein